ncbi:CBS domain-containing protein [Aliidiomarina haloalkalitolerans]|uniref:CBS domain-containing protein n=1 Tax=Aliidiomarina haloalkalitolerans TaxID=859059 RepID=A0A432VYA4_9GAMM|nr:CBS domain-containing protein [Aliidiomarina haloalkalitolerans]MCL4409802.1 CBS domain-containing protein [Gammaproteobacteria bacterium]RUO21626.1 hypothetical protein CWE06_01870 [Aliidiomarina haloalkalitolerans]
MSTYHALALKTTPRFISSTEKVLTAVQLDWHAPAYTVFDSLESPRSLILDSTTSLADAERLMRKAHCRYAWVTDSHQQLLGVVALADLSSGRAIKLAKDLRLAHDDIEVFELMTAVEELPQVSQQSFLQAMIGDVAVTMQQAGTSFLTIANDEGIVGIVSALTIAEKTGESVRFAPMATSFARLVNLKHHSDAIE